MINRLNLSFLSNTNIYQLKTDIDSNQIFRIVQEPVRFVIVC